MNVSVIIEMPKGTKDKLEVKDGLLVLDRVLDVAVPYNYGYIPNTIEPDGDPTDVFVLSLQPIPSLTKVEATIFGKFTCLDQGVSDDKYVAILKDEDLKKIPYSCIVTIEDYLETYKKGFEVLDFKYIYD